MGWTPRKGFPRNMNILQEVRKMVIDIMIALALVVTVIYTTYKIR